MLSYRPGLPGERAGGLFHGTRTEETLREYELVVVMSPDIQEEDVPAAIERVTNAVTARGGEVADVQPWGRRKLAYPINRHGEGNYVLTTIRLDPARARELESAFFISEEILRHLLVRKDEA
jgi:small subunit ribosomal protein S6